MYFFKSVLNDEILILRFNKDSVDGDTVYLQ